MFLSSISCGYKKVEGDKYPTIPLFPEHTNKNIVVKTDSSIQFERIYGDEHHYYFAHNANEKTQLIITDKYLKKKRTLSLPSDNFYISESYDIYSMVADNEEWNKVVAVQKYKAPDYKSQNIAFKCFFKELDYKMRERIEDENAELIKIKQEEDELFSSYRFADSIRRVEVALQKQQYKSEIEALFVDSLQSIGNHYHSYYLLKYPNSEKMIKVSEEFEDFVPVDEAVMKYGAEQLHNNEKYIPTEKQNAKAGISYVNYFESAVMDNHSVGANHFVPGVYVQKMLYYMDLQLFDEQVKFKTEETECVYILYQKPDEIALLVNNAIHIVTPCD